MRKYEAKTEVVENKNLTHIVCDVCHKEFDVNNADHQMEIQEFHCIDFMGGFGSVFGDGVRVTCDVCQRCLNEKLGNHMLYDGEKANEVL